MSGKLDFIHKVFLTFDVDDFINKRSMFALHRILRLLEKYRLKALFFITGHTAETLRGFPKTVALLRKQDIGYHSTSHTVRPTIVEYTDVKDFDKACILSQERELRHVNPLTGEMEGRGGLFALKELFPNKKTVFYRAPGGCWTPPHLEALSKLGIKYDFSADISQTPVLHRGITFFPLSIPIDGIRFFPCGKFLTSIVKNTITILVAHPYRFVNQEAWDRIYYERNPERLIVVPQKKQEQTGRCLLRFEVFLKAIRKLQDSRALNVVEEPESSSVPLVTTLGKVKKCYNRSVWWAKTFLHYYPKYTWIHFQDYFEDSCIDN